MFFTLFVSSTFKLDFSMYMNMNGFLFLSSPFF